MTPFLAICFSLLILLQKSHATIIRRRLDCTSSSSCGPIRNISFPFRLKDDPKNCGDPAFELSCENNATTTLNLNSHKYKVKAINYHNFTIRLVDDSINTTNTCSFPHHSLYSFHFNDNYPYTIKVKKNYSTQVAWPINFMTCPYNPLRNSSLLPACASRDDFFNFSTSTRRTMYIKVGHMNASEVEDSCRVEVIVMTSWRFKDWENVSVSEIHEALVYGFEVSWSWVTWTWCNGELKSYSELGILFTCKHHLPPLLYDVWDNIEYSFKNERPFVVLLLILLLVLVVLFAGVSLPAKIIMAFLYAWGFVLVETNGAFNSHWHVSHLGLIIGLFFAVRFVMVFPCLMWFLIIKFRTRHLSKFDEIEAFLQSDNNLMPIRYSYPDIKRMTRGFREKLGQGGYGSVYKGKLRSGHHVAVKLLKKTGSDGQDFMNEISTIGRIHHVNVVKLVGYCAERSKRALVLDFMPNGSLEKYILSQEKKKSLKWCTKYDIALGVARGIEYLHRGCDIQILHFDIKPHNILLDEKFVPKVSDFGLAKFFSTEKNTVTLTTARGTIGYVAPELINRGFGQVSYKADVYSFGMLLIEMVGLKRDLIGNNQTSSQYFPYWIYDYFDRGQDIEIEKIDDEMKVDDDNTKGIVRKMTIVALWCIQMNPNDRPSMNKVVEMFEGDVERLCVPHRPSSSPRVGVNMDESWSAYSTDSISLLSHREQK